MTTGSHPARLAILLSGGGRTMLNLHGAIERGEVPARIVTVIASRECPGAEHARNRAIPTSVEPGVISAPRLDQILTAAGAEWIVLAGYLKLLPILPRFAGRVVNIHPALLPSFGGPGMHGRHVHEAVLAAGCKVSGCTVHLCDERFDTGPIIVQRTCPVLDDDTAGSLAARVFEQECLALPEALRLLLSGRLRFEGRRARTS